MTYEDFYNQIMAIGNDMLVAEDFVRKVYSTLEKFRLDKAAQQSVQPDDYNAVPTIIKSFPMRDAYPVGDKVGSVEEAGYEFANCGTEEYRKVCWLDVLLQRAAQQPTPAEDANASPMDEVTVWECNRCKSHNTLRAIACTVCGAMR